MPLFSGKSKTKLSTCHMLLQFLLRKVVEHFDCTIIEGRRNKLRQDDMVKRGLSTLNFPLSKHNSDPSQAVDVAPYPITWARNLTPEQKIIVKEAARWYRFAGQVEGMAAVYGIPIRWGGDWDGDGELTDQTFDDLPHFELDTRKLSNDDIN